LYIDLEKKFKVNSFCKDCTMTCKQHILVKVVRCSLRQVKNKERN